ncbi:MAG: hypothetical protein F6K40_22775 [Okeania sp. SIO3I5]|uniref:hypothetical protein n=1 Tax=Okeania sp. SIO3I5 TaxID=2607805 RepID=UPI0013BB60D6|nr:hypothetical protein [Okeania sp. SIO3I5]NEQ38941.1 hypothetical protein [Okeania sp. SIO3I5]
MNKLTAVFISVNHSKGEYHSPLQNFGYGNVVHPFEKRCNIINFSTVKKQQKFKIILMLNTTSLVWWIKSDKFSLLSLAIA